MAIHKFVFDKFVFVLEIEPLGPIDYGEKVGPRKKWVVALLENKKEVILDSFQKLTKFFNENCINVHRMAEVDPDSMARLINFLLETKGRLVTTVFADDIARENRCSQSSLLARYGDGKLHRAEVGDGTHSIEFDLTTFQIRTTKIGVYPRCVFLP